MTMYTQGIDPELDFSDMPFLVAAYTRLMGMEIHPRTPYSGKLVFTAFSGSHQDAIRKGIAFRAGKAENEYWAVPYLTFDSHDIGRKYEGIIRINSQSGKGEASYILEQDYGISLPKQMMDGLELRRSFLR